MTTEELQKFLDTIAGLYLGVTLTTGAAEHWGRTCEKLPVKLAYAALELYQRDDIKKLPPQPAEILLKAQDLLMPSLRVPFQEAKAKRSYYYQRAVKEEGTVKPYNPNGHPGPKHTDMVWVEKRQQAIYDNLMRQCRRIPLEKMRDAQALIAKKDQRARLDSAFVYQESKPQDIKSVEYAKVQTLIDTAKRGTNGHQ